MYIVGTKIRQYGVLTAPVMGRILISSILALLVNISNSMVLGKTSPLTFQVIGHFKTASLIVLATWLFGYPHQTAVSALRFQCARVQFLTGGWSQQNVLGMVTTIAGVVWYTGQFIFFSHDE